MPKNEKELIKEYIYLNRQDFFDTGYPEKLTLNVAAAYRKSADKLERGFFGDIKQEQIQIIIEDMKKLLDLNNSEINNQLDTNFNSAIKQLTDFVSTITDRILYGNITMGQVAGGGGETKLSAEEVSQSLQTLQKVMQEIQDIDLAFQNVNQGQGFFAIGQQQLKKSFNAYKKIDTMLKQNHSKKSLKNMTQEIKKATNNLIGNIRGDLLEFADYMHNMAVSEALSAVENAVSNLSNVSLSGVGRTKIYGQEGQLLTSQEMKSKFGQTSFANKSDNLVTYNYNKDGINLLINFGISDKAIPSDSKKVSLADSISWQSLFLNGDFSEDPFFETCYANLVIHDPNSVTGSSIYSQYLAAKAAGFLFAGIKGGNVSQALFIRYADKLYYLPDYIRNLGEKKYINLRIKKPENKEKNPENGPNWTDAYARSRNTLTNLRKRKFEAKLIIK